MFMFNRPALECFAAGVGVMGSVELSLELLLIIVIPLKEILFIIRGDCC